MFDEHSFLYFLGSFVVVILVIFIISLILWLIGSYGLFKIGTNAGVSYSWLAFIPIANLYVLGAVTKEVTVGKYKIENLSTILPISAIAAFILSLIPLLGGLISLAFVIFIYIVHYYFYKKLDEPNAILWLILTVLGFPYPFVLFILRNKKATV